MLWENPFAAGSSGKPAAVLRDAPVAVVVSSQESRTLLYANDLACRLFLRGYRPGITCYEAGKGIRTGRSPRWNIFLTGRAAASIRSTRS